MKYLFLLILCGCYAPEKTVEFEFRYIKLTAIHKTELGFDLEWQDGTRCYPSFTTDTTNMRIGTMYRTLIKK